MQKIELIINIINIAFTVSNSILSIILKVQKSSFISETTTTLIRYNYFLYVLLDPFFKLAMTALFFDVLLYISSYLLKRFFFKLNKENEQSILIKSIQDNMMSNILVEFFFMVMIKGLALGFGFFYLIKLTEEIDKIKDIKDINNKQENILNKMVTIIYITEISIALTVGYQFVFFGIRICKACNKNSFFFAKKKLNKGDDSKNRDSKDENRSEIKEIDKLDNEGIISEKLD